MRAGEGDREAWRGEVGTGGGGGVRLRVGGMREEVVVVVVVLVLASPWTMFVHGMGDEAGAEAESAR